MNHYFSLAVKNDHCGYYERFPTEDYDSDDRFPRNHHRVVVPFCSDTPIRVEFFPGGIKKRGFYDRHRTNAVMTSICPICPKIILSSYTSVISEGGW